MIVTTEKMKFPKMVRDLRVAGRYRQREIAEAIGIAQSSYGNLESLNRITCRVDKVERLALFYGLPQDKANELIAAYRELPRDAFQQRKLDKLNAARAARSKSKQFDGMRKALVDMLGLLIAVAPDPETLCACEPGSDDRCEVCFALAELGLQPWTNSTDALAQLAALQDAAAA